MFDLAKTIKACVKGDVRAQREIYDHIGPRMMGTCRRYIADPDDAEEVFHDAMLKVYRYLETYRGDSALTTWANRIAVNASLDFLRKVKKNPVMEYLSDSDTDYSEPPDTEIENLTAEAALRNIRKLSATQQLLINLYIIEEYSHKEIAGLLNITEQASRSILLRAKRALYSITVKSTGQNETKRAITQ